MYLLGLNLSQNDSLELVAKFDAPKRARWEWQSLHRLRRLQGNQLFVLPRQGNMRTDGFILYDLAFSGSNRPSRVLSLHTLLNQQFSASFPNCLVALRALLRELEHHYTYTRRPPQTSRSWLDVFRRTQRDDFESLLGRIEQRLQVGWPGIRWSEPSVKIPDLPGELTNPFVFFRKLVRPRPLPDDPLPRLLHDCPIALVHGDLHFDNVLLGCDEYYRMSAGAVRLIDPAHAETGPIALDLAKLEVEFWLEVVASSAGEKAPSIYRNVQCILEPKASRASLDRATPAFQDRCVRWVRELRRASHRISKKWTRSSSMEDHHVVLLRHYLRALTYPDIFGYDSKRRMALLGAAVSADYLARLQSGVLRLGRGQETPSPRYPPISTPTPSKLEREAALPAPSRLDASAGMASITVGPRARPERTDSGITQVAGRLGDLGLLLRTAEDALQRWSRRSADIARVVSGLRNWIVLQRLDAYLKISGHVLHSEDFCGGIKRALLAASEPSNQHVYARVDGVLKRMTENLASPPSVRPATACKQVSLVLSQCRLSIAVARTLFELLSAHYRLIAVRGRRQPELAHDVGLASTHPDAVGKWISEVAFNMDVPKVLRLLGPTVPAYLRSRLDAVDVRAQTQLRTHRKQLPAGHSRR